MYNQLPQHPGQRGGARHVPGDSDATPSSSSRKRSWRSCSSSEAQLSEKFGDKHPEIVKIKSAIQSVAAEAADGEIAKVVQSVRTEYQAALAQENSLAAALTQQKGEALSMNRKAHRLQRARARRAEQQADLREPDAAREGDRRLQRAEDQQHPRRRPGERPRCPGRAAQGRSNLLLGFLVRDHPRAADWRSSSSTWTAASRRRTSSRRTSVCRRSAWCRRSTRRPGVARSR